VTRARDVAAVADLLDCPRCGGLHAVPWCVAKARRGDLPQMRLTFTEAEALAPHSVPLPEAVNLDLFRASQEELPL
jgi:hypothetical protein